MSDTAPSADLADDWFERLLEPCPVEPGTRIELLGMPNDPHPLPVGSTGTVTGGNAAQLHVDWDNGSRLHLVLPHDTYRVLDR